MRSRTVVVCDGERMGDIDYAFPFMESGMYNCTFPIEKRAELIQRHVDLIREVERRYKAGELLQVRNSGDYWHDVIDVGMYDGWPFWKPTPAVCRRDHVLGGIVWEFWYELHGVRAICRRENGMSKPNVTISRVTANTLMFLHPCGLQLKDCSAHAELREALLRGDIGINTSADSDAKATPADGSITLGPDAGNFAEAIGDATAEADEISPQRVKASHLPADFAKQFYEAARRGERPPVPVADDDVVRAAERGSWENLRRADNRLYGCDILTLRLIARIKRFVIIKGGQ